MKHEVGGPLLHPSAPPLHPAPAACSPTSPRLCTKGHLEVRHAFVEADLRDRGRGARRERRPHDRRERGVERQRRGKGSDGEPVRETRPIRPASADRTADWPRLLLGAA